MGFLPTVVSRFSPPCVQKSEYSFLNNIFEKGTFLLNFMPYLFSPLCPFKPPTFSCFCFFSIGKTSFSFFFSMQFISKFSKYKLAHLLIRCIYTHSLSHTHTLSQYIINIVLKENSMYIYSFFCNCSHANSLPQVKGWTPSALFCHGILLLFGHS